MKFKVGDKVTHESYNVKLTVTEVFINKDNDVIVNAKADTWSKTGPGKIAVHSIKATEGCFHLMN